MADNDDKQKQPLSLYIVWVAFIAVVGLMIGMYYQFNSRLEKKANERSVEQMWSRNEQRQFQRSVERRLDRLEYDCSPQMVPDSHQPRSYRYDRNESTEAPHKANKIAVK